MPGIDHQRFSNLIEPHLDALFRAAYRLTRNRADAEDLVQDACIRACQQLAGLRETGPVKSWLLRVMHNLYVDGARRAKRSPIDAWQAQPAEVTSPAATPEESLDQRQSVDQLERAWSRLDRDHQSLLALRAEGYSLAEISAITNIATDALNMRLYRARQSLTRHLQQERTPTPTPMEATK